MSPKPDYRSIHKKIIKFIPSIHQLILKDYHAGVSLYYKHTGFASTSIVTDTDKLVERHIKTALKRIFPPAGFIGEETKAQVKQYNWIIDPIDGTLNFANHVPVFAVSIALWEGNKPRYAFASFPVFDEIVHAIDGQGLYLNGRLTKSTDQTPKRFFLVYAIVGDNQLRKRLYPVIVDACRSPRNFGSCVFHGVNTALRRFDAAVMINQAIWDIGGVGLMAQEAGLSYRYLSPPPDLSKTDLKQYQHSLVIATHSTVKKIADKIKPLLQ